MHNTHYAKTPTYLQRWMQRNICLHGWVSLRPQSRHCWEVYTIQSSSRAAGNFWVTAACSRLHRAGKADWLMHTWPNMTAPLKHFNRRLCWRAACLFSHRQTDFGSTALAPILFIYLFIFLPLIFVLCCFNSGKRRTTPWRVSPLNSAKLILILCILHCKIYSTEVELGCEEASQALLLYCFFTFWDEVKPVSPLLVGYAKLTVSKKANRCFEKCLTVMSSFGFFNLHMFRLIFSKCSQQNHEKPKAPSHLMLMSISHVEMGPAACLCEGVRICAVSYPTW